MQYARPLTNFPVTELLKVFFFGTHGAGVNQIIANKAEALKNIFHKI